MTKHAALVYLFLTLAQGPLTPPALVKPQPVGPRVEAARLRLVSGDAKGAAADLEAILSTAPQTPEAHYWLGIAYLDLGQRENARRALAEALSLKSGSHPDALYHLGLIAMQTSHPLEAISLLERALAQSRGPFPAAENALGAAYVSARDFDRAIDLLDRGVATRPEDPTAQHLLGLAREQRFLHGGDASDIGRAAEAHQRAIDARPDYGIAHRDLALVLLWNGRAAEAASHLERFATLQPAHPSAVTFRDLAVKLRAGLSQPRPADTTSSAPQLLPGAAGGRSVAVYAPRVMGSARPAGFESLDGLADGIVLADGSFFPLGAPDQGSSNRDLEDALAASRFAPGRIAGRASALRVLVSAKAGA
jgi:tetratricopeptide (TPR) repeat protein